MDNFLYSPLRSGYNYLKTVVNLSYHLDNNHPIDYYYLRLPYQNNGKWVYKSGDLFREIPFQRTEFYGSKIEKKPIYHSHQSPHHTGGSFNEEFKNPDDFKISYLLRDFSNLYKSLNRWSDNLEIALRNVLLDLKYWNDYYSDNPNRVYLINYSDILNNPEEKIYNLMKYWGYGIKKSSIQKILPFTTKEYMFKIIPSIYIKDNKRVTFYGGSNLPEKTQKELLGFLDTYSINNPDIRKGLKAD